MLREYVAHAAAEAADPRVPGFVRAVGAVMTEPRIAEALAADERALRGGLQPWVRRAQAAGQVRTDLSAARLTDWLMLLLDGFLGRLAGGDAFTAKRERGDPARRGRAAAGARRRLRTPIRR